MGNIFCGSILLMLFTQLVIQPLLLNGMDLDVKSIIGGLDSLEPDNDMEKDELFLEDFNEEQINEYKKKMSVSIDSILDEDSEDESELYIMTRKIDIETSMIHYFKVEQLDYDAEVKVKPIVSIANDLFYKLYHLDESIGINQEVRDTIVKLVLQAQENVAVILQIWSDYKEPVRAKFIRSFDELEKDLEIVKEEYKDKLQNFEYEYGDYEKFYVKEAIERSERTLKSVRETEKRIHRMFNVFIKEERNLIKLGVKLWVNSQEDYDIRMEKKRIEDEESAFLNERRNQLQRKLITKMNINRANVKNETISKPVQIKKDEL